MSGIWVGQMKLNGLGESAVVTIGPNFTLGVHAAMKSVAGHSWVSGDYAVLPTTNGFINDADLLDNPVWHTMGFPVR